MSPTGLQALELCERYGYLTYVRNIARSSWNDKLAFGGAVHAALAEYGRAAMAGSELPLLDQVFAQELDRQVQDILNANAGVSIPDAEVASLRQLGAALLPAYADWAAGQPVPCLEKILHVEQPFELETVAGSPVGGVLDLVGQDAGGGIWIGDYKTCTQLPNQLMLLLDKQAGIYLYAGWRLWGERFRGLFFDHMRKQDPERTQAPLFLRTVLPCIPEEMPHWEGECDHGWAWTSNLARAPLSRTTYSPGQHCSWRCPFTDVCMAARTRSDPELEAMLAHYTVRSRRAFEE